MNPKIHIIALDLDGTLFNRDRQITPYTKEQIKKAVDRGIAVVISTGRPYVGLPLEEAAVLGIRYAITTNGAAVYEIPTRTCLYEKCMSEDFSWKILGEVLKKHVHLDAFVHGDAYTQTSTLEVVRHSSLPESTRNYILTTRDQVEDISAFFKKNHLRLQKATINFEIESDGRFVDREETKELLLSYPQIQVVCGGYNNLEFTSAGVTKGAGLRFLCEHLNIPIESAMVCGDSENDKDIMEAAGFAVAMGNAEREIKEIADYVTATNEEDGVGLAIEKFAL